MQRTVTFLLLAGVLAIGLAAVPGDNYGYYDDGTRDHKVCYTLTEQGWGVKFTPEPGKWVKITDIEVNLCPPPIDGPYTGKVIIYGDNDGVPDGGDVLWTGTHDIRIGEWWHYLHLNNPVWTNEPFYVFHVIDASCQYPQYCYQWFDGTDNAPSGTQWYKSRTNVFTQDNTVGDIEIRVKFEAHDVAAVSIETPTSPQYADEEFSPTAYVKNEGGYAESNVPVTFSIDGTPYASTKYVDFPANSTPILVTFDTDNWEWGTGSFTMRCAVGMDHDWNPADDAVTKDLQVAARDVVDAGAVGRVSPPDPCHRNQTYPLNVVFKNFGSGPATFAVRCSLIRPNGTVAGRYSKTVTGLGSGLTREVQFANRRYQQMGTWKVVSWSNLTGDQNRGNDTSITTFVSMRAQGWAVGNEMPAATALKVDNGAALTGDGGSQYFLLKGKREPQVYTFNDVLAEPAVVGAVPQSVVKVGTGTSIAYLDGLVYLLKANRSLKFYSLNPGTGEWARLADMPIGLSGRPPKHGCRLVAADGKLYALKGNKTNELYCYDPATGDWTTLASMPAGAGKFAADGAALCSDNGRLFAFKGNKTNEFYTYDIASDGWQQLADVPNKARAGAGLSFENRAVYATVGGGKMEFYSYNMLTNQWTRLEDVPLLPDRRKVKGAAAMTSIEGAVMLVKGKKAQAILAYGTDGVAGAGQQPEEGVQAAPSESPSSVFVSSPVRTFVRLNYSLSEPARIRLYNGSGTLVRTITAGRTGAQFGVADLPNGTYVLEIAAGSATMTRQLVVEH